MANDDAAREAGTETSVEARHFERAAGDYFPSRDVELLEYMELLAVFEASSRRLLPAKYASMTPEELDLRLRTLRLAVGSRRYDWPGLDVAPRRLPRGSAQSPSGCQRMCDAASLPR